MSDSLATSDPIDDIASAIDACLPDIARSVIERHLDQTVAHNRQFFAHPDDRTQHQTQWHQWGIITHTRKFLQLFDHVLPQQLSDWGLFEAVDNALSHAVDGIPRRKLLRVSILLHDVGKFGARTRGRNGFHFAGHERLSGRIIRDHLDLERFGLTRAQIEYVAVTAEDHFVLGLLRKRAREDGMFTLDYTESRRFQEDVLGIKQAHAEDYVEVGVLFLGDSMAKADPAHGPDRAVSQNVVNIAVGRRYLELTLA